MSALKSTMQPLHDLSLIPLKIFKLENFGGTPYFGFLYGKFCMLLY
jgi:hypothetical protein